MTATKAAEIKSLQKQVEKQTDALNRVRSLARFLDGLAPGDQHYAKRIREALGDVA